MSNLPLFINTQVYILGGPGYCKYTVHSCLCPVFVSVCVFDFTFVFVFVCFWSLASASVCTRWPRLSLLHSCERCTHKPCRTALTKTLLIERNFVTINGLKDSLPLVVSWKLLLAQQSCRDMFHWGAISFTSTKIIIFAKMLVQGLLARKGWWTDDQ